MRRDDQAGFPEDFFAFKNCFSKYSLALRKTYISFHDQGISAAIEYNRAARQPA